MPMARIARPFVLLWLAAGLACRPAPAVQDGGSPPATSGVCASSCDKACTADQDCNTGVGELCCDFGSRGKICQSAKSCPKLCTGNTDCTAAGQSCAKTTFASPQLTCEPAGEGLTFCKSDADCPMLGSVCCGDYSKSFCVPGTRCPKACTVSSDCATESGEACCTSAKISEPSLNVAGLCLNPKYEPCAVACT